MLPIGPLMIEHRLMERMISLLGKEVARMERERDIDSVFLDGAVDFIKNYVDRCHHGKEEDILLAELEQKNVSEGHRSMMEQILDDHRKSREAITELEGHVAKYLSGYESAVEGAVKSIRFLVELYPRHIEMEDRRFFLPCMEYFNAEEKNEMLEKEHVFDRNLIHQIYRVRVEREEARFARKRRDE